MTQKHSTRKWAIRSIQMDLARQMETVDFIKEFSDFAAENGFNSLTLYLEGRIRTKSFPFPSAKESYSPAQIREIVRHASQRGLDVIPVVSTLGHAEMFLKYPTLASLAETRPPFSGRFGARKSGHVFCPSLEQTYEFLRSYLGEVHALFSSPYFHAGCDEVWDMGCCDLCRKRLRRGESQAGIFTRHLERVHEIITGEFGCRMILWDDMFEYYPEALESLPRDVLLAHWQYESRVGPSRSHFFNRRVEDTPAKYERMGFDYLICPADYTLENAESFTASVAGRRPLGGLLTTWEKSDSFMLQNRPLIAAVGRMWAEGASHADLPTVIQSLFGIRDPVFTRAIRALCRSGLYLERRLCMERDYLTCRENTHNYARESLADLLCELLPAYRSRILPNARPILDEILLSLACERVSHQLDSLAPEFFLKASGADRKQRLEEICTQIKKNRDARLALWYKVRPGISSRDTKAFYASYLADCRKLPAHAASHGILRVHFFLPDQYSAQTVRVSVRYADARSWERVFEGICKELRHFDAFYSRIFPIARDRTPKELRIETFGFGGQGFTWFEAVNRRGRFIPEKVHPKQGTLDNLENLLIHDWQWAFSGERNTAANYLNPELARKIHKFHIDLYAADEK